MRVETSKRSDLCPKLRRRCRRIVWTTDLLMGSQSAAFLELREIKTFYIGYTFFFYSRLLHGR